MVAPGSNRFAGKLMRLGSESLVYGLSSIVGRLLSYLLQPYYAHHFDAAQNGVQSVVYSYIPIISIAFYLGMDVAYMRNAAATQGNTKAGERAFTESFAIVLAIGALVTAACFAAAPWLATAARLDSTSFRYMMIIVYSDALLAVPFAYLRMAGRAWRYASLRLAFVGLSVAGNIVLIGHFNAGVSAIFLTNIGANIAVLLLVMADIARLFRPALLRGAAWRELWGYALPIMPAMLGVMIVENGDRLVLNYLPEAIAHSVYGMGSKDVVGIYSFNYKLGVAMLLVVQMFRLAWTPFALQHAREPDAPQLFSRVLTALMLVCASGFLIISVLLPVLVAIPAVHQYVKPAYWLGLPIVPVILLGYVFTGIYTVVTSGLYVERRTSVLPWIAGAGAALNVATCIVASRRWGMVGVAWATPASYALMAALGAWQSGRVFRVPFEWRRLVHLAIVTALLFAIDRWAEAVGVRPLSVAGLSLKLVLIAALPTILALTQFFRAGEWRALRSLGWGRT